VLLDAAGRSAESCTHKSSSGISSGKVAGIVVGVVFGVAIIVIIAGVIVSRRRRTKSLNKLRHAYSSSSSVPLEPTK